MDTNRRLVCETFELRVQSESEIERETSCKQDAIEGKQNEKEKAEK